MISVLTRRDIQETGGWVRTLTDGQVWLCKATRHIIGQVSPSLKHLFAVGFVSGFAAGLLLAIPIVWLTFSAKKKIRLYNQPEGRDSSHSSRGRTHEKQKR